MKITMRRKEISPMLEAYEKKFDHIPSPEALSDFSIAELDQIAEKAIRRNEPVREWLERPQIRYGTTIDRLYGE